MAFSLSRGGERTVGRTDLQPFIVAGVVHLLRNTRDRDAVARAVKHLRLSIDEPIADWRHLRAQKDGRLLPFREAVAALGASSLSAQVERIDVSDTGMFTFDPAEAYARVVTVYTLDYSHFMPSASAVRARFVVDPRATQEWFLARFLELYDEGTDVTHLAGAPDAAAWLRERRHYTAQHTVVFRASPAAGPDLSTLEHELREAVASLEALLALLHRALATPLVVPRGPPVERVYSEVSFIWGCVQELLSPPPTSPAADSDLKEVLAELHVPPPRRDFACLVVGCAQMFTHHRLPESPESPTLHEAFPTLLAAWQRLDVATQQALRHGW